MKAVLFDLDQTLVDRDAAVVHYLEELGHHRGLPVGAHEPFRQRFLALDQHGYGDKRELFQTLAAEFALAATAEELRTHFQTNVWRGCRLLDGMAETLEELRARGFRLGIITNGSVESQSAKVAVCGLSRWMDVVLISAAEGLRKPDPAIFARAARRLNVESTECVFVGDCPVRDVQGAHGAGMRAVWFQSFLPWPDDLSPVPCDIVSAPAELLRLSHLSGRA